MNGRCILNGFRTTLLTASVFSLVGASSVLAEGLGSDFDPSTVGEQTLTLWWLGNQEIPGIEDWMAESIAAYEKLYPNIKVETSVEAVDTYNTQQKTACRGGSGPSSRSTARPFPRR